MMHPVRAYRDWLKLGLRLEGLKLGLELGLGGGGGGGGGFVHDIWRIAKLGGCS